MNPVLPILAVREIAEHPIQMTTIKDLFLKNQLLRRKMRMGMKNHFSKTAEMINQNHLTKNLLPVKLTLKKSGMMVEMKNHFSKKETMTNQDHSAKKHLQVNPI